MTRLLAKLRVMFTVPACGVCGVHHGPLMTLDMNGKLTTAGTSRAVILRHYAKEIDAARELGRMLRAKR